MNKGRIGKDRGSKEMDRCPLTMTTMCTNAYMVNFYPPALNSLT
jgi:hypothetical protein